MAAHVTNLTPIEAGNIVLVMRLRYVRERRCASVRIGVRKGQDGVGRK